MVLETSDGDFTPVTDDLDELLDAEDRLLIGSSRLPEGPYNNKSYLGFESDWLEEPVLESCKFSRLMPEAAFPEVLPVKLFDPPGSISDFAPAPKSRKRSVRLPKGAPDVRPAPSYIDGVGYALSPDKLSVAQVEGAKMLNLLIGPTSDPAKAMVDRMVARIKAREIDSRLRNRRKDAEQQLRDSVGAILGNLLREWGRHPPLPVWRSMRAASFTGESVRVRTFVTAMNAMLALGFIRKRKGGNPKDGGPGYASRFWPADLLLHHAFDHGITAETVQNHFGRRKLSPSICKPPKVRDPLRLKKIPPHPNSKRTSCLPIDPHDPIAAYLRGQVDTFNAFARTCTVEGCTFPRWQRTFYGDYRLYGRMHALGDGNYQSMSAAARLAEIRINGEAVVEIDFSSSLLTFMHGLAGLPRPQGDLYKLHGFPRDVVKKCVNATLGNGKPLLKWPKDALKETPELANYSIADVTAAMVARYPFMAEPWRLAEGSAHLASPHRTVIHMLMGVESDVVMDALLALRERGVLGLPMHDGVLVPASAETVAYALLLDAGERIAGLTLRLDVDRPHAATPLAATASG